MAKVRNVSSLGDLIVSTLGIEVKAGEVVEVSDEAAASLLDQPSNWEAADKAAASITKTNAPDTPAEA